MSIMSNYLRVAGSFPRLPSPDVPAQISICLNEQSLQHLGTDDLSLNHSYVTFVARATGDIDQITPPCLLGQRYQRLYQAQWVCTDHEPSNM
ncbi:hypothetical protein AFLA_010705 [Aspergillus flavus NRRL3357]|nr:hypothetical protein AFLA_010705 [Aspergillus flavus NRRL3357]